MSLRLFHCFVTTTIEPLTGRLSCDYLRNAILGNSNSLHPFLLFQGLRPLHISCRSPNMFDVQGHQFELNTRIWIALTCKFRDSVDFQYIHAFSIDFHSDIISCKFWPTSSTFPVLTRFGAIFLTSAILGRLPNWSLINFPFFKLMGRK